MSNTYPKKHRIIAERIGALVALLMRSPRPDAGDLQRVGVQMDRAGLPVSVDCTFTGGHTASLDMEKCARELRERGLVGKVLDTPTENIPLN